ncbi:outer membrane lipoprotein carrier protein LolA [Agromyces tropicus]|uniref:Outer membrane lipoprotein carrier protein LolA n=1 Tax=Agromyces tropicus TaxID=555371 RepID=A0ABN2UDV5_9MICO
MSPRADGPSRARARTVVPAIGVPVAIAVAILVPMQANAAVDLPDKTPDELVAFAKASEVDALSGTIAQRSELGLPDLGGLTGGAPGSGGDGGDAADADGTPASVDDLIDLATGSFDAKVYVDGEHARLQVLDTLAERNVYVNPGEAWFVDSETRTATRLAAPDEADLAALREELERLADDAAAEAEAGRPDGEQLPTPQQLLDRALDRLDETTEVSVGTDGRVAGREAYELVLRPDTDETLVGEIRIAIDGENGAALAASVTARGAGEPAFSTAFTDVSFAAPGASVFAFEPGDAFTVAEEELPLPTVAELDAWVADAQARADEGADAAGDAPHPVVHGEGWATVVEFDADALAQSMAERRGATGDEAGVAPATEPPFSEDEVGALDAVTTPVDGGRALATSLLSVLFTDDGRVLAGSVPVDTLLAYAGSGR